jgi:hypothetical protein
LGCANRRYLTPDQAILARSFLIFGLAFNPLEKSSQTDERWLRTSSFA